MQYLNMAVLCLVFAMFASLVKAETSLTQLEVSSHGFVLQETAHPKSRKKAKKKDHFHLHFRGVNAGLGVTRGEVHGQSFSGQSLLLDFDWNSEAPVLAKPGLSYSWGATAGFQLQRADTRISGGEFDLQSVLGTGSIYAELRAENDNQQDITVRLGFGPRIGMREVEYSNAGSSYDSLSLIMQAEAYIDLRSELADGIDLFIRASSVFDSGSSVSGFGYEQKSSIHFGFEIIPERLFN